MTIFAETERLYLRAMQRSELPRLTELIGEWDIVRWLSVVPFPYTLQDAEDFYDEMEPSYRRGLPELYAVASKPDCLLIGAVGLHPPRSAHEEGETEIGYWLAKNFWGRGLMLEAVQKTIELGFARPATRMIGAVTAPSNRASQNILRKAGLRCLGERPRDYAALRGEDTILKWLLTREEYDGMIQG